MIKTIFFCITMSLFITACSKKSTSNTTSVDYQVVATNSSMINIIYNNVLGNKVSTSSQNSWTFNIPNVTKPFTAYIQAASNSPFTSVTTECTVTILVNGSVVKTATISSNTIATAEAEFVIQ